MLEGINASGSVWSRHGGINASGSVWGQPDSDPGTIQPSTVAEIGTTTENNPATRTNTNTELTEIISL